MATEFKLPDLGENIASGDVVTVFVSEGDIVKPGQTLLEVETDKAVIEVPCASGGQVAKVLVKKGDTVKVGQGLVLLDAPGAAPAKAAAPQAATAKPAPAPAAAAPKPAARVAAGHVASVSSGWSGRSARSVKRHQPSVMPNVRSAKSQGSTPSAKRIRPPGASRAWRSRGGTPRRCWGAVRARW